MTVPSVGIIQFIFFLQQSHEYSGLSVYTVRIGDGCENDTVWREPSGTRSKDVHGILYMFQYMAQNDIIVCFCGIEFFE